MIDDGPSPSYELLAKADRRRQQRDAALARVAELEVEVTRLRTELLRRPLADARDFRTLADAVIEWFNPPDDDVAEIAIYLNSIKYAGEFIRSVPCSCPEGASTYEVLPCKRCQALGRVADKPEEY